MKRRNFLLGFAAFLPLLSWWRPFKDKEPHDPYAKVCDLYQSNLIDKQQVLEAMRYPDFEAIGKRMKNGNS